MEIVNLTHRNIRLQVPNGKANEYRTYAPDKIRLRVEFADEELAQQGEANIFESKARLRGGNIPQPQDGVFWIVEPDVALLVSPERRTHGDICVPIKPLYRAGRVWYYEGVTIVR